MGIALVCLAGCGGGQSSPPKQKPDVYDAREPGSDVSPTNDASFQLLGVDGPTRFASMQQLILHYGKRCGSVTKAVIVGGTDGTDEWRVDCGDTGKWQVWFNADSEPSVAQCANAACT